MSFYSVIHKLFARAVRAVFRVRLYGEENEPASGPCIVCCNHLSDCDVVILAACLKRQPRYMAKSELFKIPLLKQLITALGAYPVERKRGDVNSIKRTLSLLEEGELVGIYPQGTRCPGVYPSTTRVHSGAAMLAARSGATVLPVAIECRNFRVRIFHRTDIIFGKPITPAELGLCGERNPSLYASATAEIFRRVCNLLGQHGMEHPTLPAPPDNEKAEKINVDDSNPPAHSSRAHDAGEDNDINNEESSK